MRERIIVPINKLHRSATLSLDQLALVETLGIGAHAVDRAGLTPGENVLVIGAGPIGLTAMQFALSAGANVIAMDFNEGRLSFCREQLRVEKTLHPGEEALSILLEMTDGDLPTAVFDATGNPDSMQGAFKFVAPGGKLILVGLFLGDLSFYDPDFHRKEMTLFATRNSTGSDFRRILKLMETGKLDTTPWISHRCAIDEMQAEFSTWLEPATGVIKAVVAVN